MFIFVPQYTNARWSLPNWAFRQSFRMIKGILDRLDGPFGHFFDMGFFIVSLLSRLLVNAFVYLSLDQITTRSGRVYSSKYCPL